MEMGWQPDPEAARLMRYLRESRVQRVESTLAIFNDFTVKEDLHKVEYTRRLLQGAQSRARSLGYHLDEIWLRAKGLTAKRVTSILRARGIHGILIPPEADPLPRLKLDWSQFSVVATTTTALPENLHRVLPDNYNNLRMVFDEVTRRHFRRPWLLTLHHLEERTERCPATLYYATCAANASITPLPIFYWDDPQNKTAPDERLAKGLTHNRPDVMIIADYWMLDVLEKFPECKEFSDIPVICYANHRPGSLGIDQLPEKVGSAAVDMLSSHVQRGDVGLPETPKSLRIPGKLLS